MLSHLCGSLLTTVTPHLTATHQPRRHLLAPSSSFTVALCHISTNPKAIKGRLLSLQKFYHLQITILVQTLCIFSAIQQSSNLFFFTKPSHTIIMVKKEVILTMEEFLRKADNNIKVQPHLDEAIVEPAGFFRRAVTTTGLWKLVTVRPSQILTKPVAEFLLNLNENKIRSSITDPSTGKLTYVSHIKIAEILDLPREGVDSFSKLNLSVDVEYARFAPNRNVEWKDRGKNMRTDLEKPYNFICELYTKSVVCNIRGLGQVSDNKLFAVSTIVDSITGTKFNWFNWFIRNIQEAAKDF